MTEGNRLINHLIERIERSGDQGIIASFDLAKAFDTISHHFLFNLLPKYGLPQKYIQLVKLLYTGAETAVLNNSRTTKFIPLGRSCRQGDPISPYLFILAFEPLIRKLVQSDDIVGLPTPSIEIKASAYADDLTTFTKNSEGLARVIDNVKEFGSFAGPKVNEDKTEILCIGDVQPGEAYTNYIKDFIKVTGVAHSTNRHTNLTEDINFHQPLDKLRNLLNLWKSRNLSLLGRAHVIRTQGLTQFATIANAITTPDRLGP